MCESCGTCTHYTPDPPDTGPGPSRTMPGFGQCAELNRAHQSDATRVSSWPWGCRFTPSRYDGQDKDAVVPEVLKKFARVLEGPVESAAVKDDRPPLELT